VYQIQQLIWLRKYYIGEKMKKATRINKDTWIIDVDEFGFHGRKLVTQDEWTEGWKWDGPWIEKMFMDINKEKIRI
jgi:hypothetical protein